MDEARSFLAEEVLVEKRVVTYRYLSRALKIPVNVAKRALFDFHKSQNAKTPGALHATYLLYGTKTQDSSHADGDVSMEDVDADADAEAGYLLAEQVPTFFMTLVAEEHLEAALAQYATLEAIHVYSLSTDPVADLQVLADATRQLQDLRETAAVEENPKMFGTIPNSHVRRRQRKGQAPSAFTAKPAKVAADTHAPGSIWDRKKGEAASPAKGDTKSDVKSSASEETPTPGATSIWNRLSKKGSAAASPLPAAEEGTAATAAAAAPGAATATSTPAPATKPASLSGTGGGIMQAFAKGAAAAAKKPKKAATPVVAAKKEDTSMALSDEEDAGFSSDDAGLVIPKAQPVTGGKTRKEREEELRKMMEEDDDDDDDDDKNEEDEREDIPMEDVVVDDTPPPAAAASASAKTDEPGEVLSTNMGDGRRRGKRRVMKKKMIQDENGYLVTIQEPAWESFSEDEAPPKPTEAAAAAAAKPKKPVPKTGQGNIMSFFAKK